MLSAVRDAAVIMKAAYGRNMLYSDFVEHLDFVSVDPGSLGSLSAAVRRAQGMLAAGRNLIVFPEGTRSVTGRLLPFRDIAFRLARSAGVPVVPVVLQSDLPFMAKRPGSIFPRAPSISRCAFWSPCGCRRRSRWRRWSNASSGRSPRNCGGLTRGPCGR